MRIVLSSLVLLSLAVLASADTTIDNPALSGLYNSTYGSDPTGVGQSFTAPAGENRLAGFTLFASGAGATDVGTFRVYAVAGSSLGSLLYQSSPFTLDGTVAPRSFTPDLAVVPGSTYLVLLTETQGTIVASSGTDYAGGMAYTGAPPAIGMVPGSDLAFRATFTSVQATPEPVTMALGAGAFGLALRRRRKA